MRVAVETDAVTSAGGLQDAGQWITRSGPSARGGNHAEAESDHLDCHSRHRGVVPCVAPRWHTAAFRGGSSVRKVGAVRADGQAPGEHGRRTGPRLAARHGLSAAYVHYDLPAPYAHQELPAAYTDHELSAAWTGWRWRWRSSCSLLEPYAYAYACSLGSRRKPSRYADTRPAAPARSRQVPAALSPDHPQAVAPVIQAHHRSVMGRTPAASSHEWRSTPTQSTGIPNTDYRK